MTNCLQKLSLSLLESYVSYEFSILHSYFHYCFSFQCCHQALQNTLAPKTDRFSTAQWQIENRTVLAKIIALMIT